MTICRSSDEDEKPFTYKHPYDGFPLLNLPLHPYAAIAHAHQAFIGISVDDLNDEHLQSYNNVERIWSLWGELESYNRKACPSPAPLVRTVTASPRASTSTKSSSRGDAVRAGRIGLEVDSADIFTLAQRSEQRSHSRNGSERSGRYAPYR